MIKQRKYVDTTSSDIWRNQQGQRDSRIRGQSTDISENDLADDISTV